MWHVLSRSVSFFLLLWSTTYILIVESMGIDSMGIGSMGTESSGIDATASVPFQTMDQGVYSGIKDAFTDVYRTRQEYEAFWERHGSDRNPPPNIPLVDFTTRMVAVVFMGSQPTSGFSVRVTSVEQDEGGELVVNFVTSVPSPTSMQTQALTQPYHIVSVDTTENDVTFEGSQAARVPLPLSHIPKYIVSFEKDADFDARATQIEENPVVVNVQKLNALRMVFVDFDSENITNDQALAFLQGLEGVKDVEADH